MICKNKQHFLKF